MGSEPENRRSAQSTGTTWRGRPRGEEVRDRPPALVDEGQLGAALPVSFRSAGCLNWWYQQRQDDAEADVPQGKAETGSGRVTAEQRWVLALVSAASFLVILDMLVVATALTSIQRHLGSSLASLEWTDR